MKSPFKKLYKKALDTTFSKEELKNSTRISKSATPKYTTDWYVKWVASAFVLVCNVITRYSRVSRNGFDIISYWNNFMVMGISYLER